MISKKLFFLTRSVDIRTSYLEREVDTMKNIRKRFSNIFLSVVLMCMSLSTTVSAAETTEETEAPTYYNVEVTSEGIASIVDQDGNSVSPASLASSISAYKQS